MFDMLKTLCAKDGCSGDESAVAAHIISLLPDDCISYSDGLGNLIVSKKGIATPKNKVLLAAHMDEVGFIVTYITEDGYLRFSPVGGVNASVVIGRQLHFKNGTVGVIGTRAMHQMDKEEREKPVEFEELMIDIGASSREEAEQKVRPGDCAYFECGYTELGNGKIKAKAIDDRMGCDIAAAAEKAAALRPYLRVYRAGGNRRARSENGGVFRKARLFHRCGNYHRLRFCRSKRRKARLQSRQRRCGKLYG